MKPTGNYQHNIVAEWQQAKLGWIDLLYLCLFALAAMALVLC